MKNKKTIKNIFIILIVAIGLLVLYSIIRELPEENTSNSSLSSLIGLGSFEEIKESNTNFANAEILKILGNIKNINLKDDIFNNPVFKKLEDSYFAIPNPTHVGRPNPFVSIGFDLLIQEDGNPIPKSNTDVLSEGNYESFILPEGSNFKEPTF